jgi:hypothetical protein
MLDELFGRGVRSIANRFGWRVPSVVSIIGSIVWFIWEIVGHVSVLDWVADKLHKTQTGAVTATKVLPLPHQPIGHHLYPPLALFCIGLLWLTVLLIWPTVSARGRSLLRRTRLLIKDLTAFVETNEGNVYAIHWDYDAKFRSRVNTIFSELAARELIIVAEDYEINPQTQTAKNIRENILDRLNKLADRLEARQSAPRSKLVGEIESGKFTVSGSVSSHGTTIPNVNVCVMIRVTNSKPIETTLKRASLKLTVAGNTYVGHKQTLWNLRDGPDLLQTITAKTPIRHGPATVGSLEFNVQGLARPQHSLAADTSVTLIDEFEVPHVIRNRQLWIAA